MINRQKKSRIRSVLKWIGWVLLVQIVLINISAALYAYKLTHLYPSPGKDWQKAGTENFLKKTWRLFTGPRIYKVPEIELPSFAYSSVKLNISKENSAEGWYGKTDSVAKGTVILFHAYSVSRASVLQQANEFRYWGYNVFLVSASGHGNSNSNITTLGYHESRDVKEACDYIQGLGEKRIILWGASMGAVEIMKAIVDFELKPSGIILEMPFGSLQSLLERRARTFGFPPQPFAFLTTFWIGAERGFNGFSFNNIKYAAGIQCPVLLQYGNRDYLVPVEDTKAMYDAMSSRQKKLVEYEGVDHEWLLQKNTTKWRDEVGNFLKTL